MNIVCTTCHALAQVPSGSGESPLSGQSDQGIGIYYLHPTSPLSYTKYNTNTIYNAHNVKSLSGQSYHGIGFHPPSFNITYLLKDFYNIYSRKKNMEDLTYFFFKVCSFLPQLLFSPICLCLPFQHTEIDSHLLSMRINKDKT